MIAFAECAPAGAVCGWCGAPATLRIELEAPRFGTVYDPRIHAPRKTLVRAAVTADACIAHADIRDRRGGTERRDPRRRPTLDKTMPMFPDKPKGNA